MCETALAKLDAACRILSEVSAPFELKALRDDLTSVQQWLKRRGASLELQNQAAEFRLRAERKLGALLAETVVPRGHHGGVLGAAKSLPEGVSKKQSQR